MPTRQHKENGISPLLRQKLNTAHRGLLRIHKSLIDYERSRFEKTHGPISGPGEFLQLVIHNPEFAWLRPISALVAEIDEYLDSREPVDPAAGESLLVQARKLLVPSETAGEFQRAYHLALQASPEVASSHAEWKRENL